jgi:aryl-alcohol dehydrogenase-like predicted oxidoreductase
VPAPARRPLGTSGLSIAPLVFGGNVFGWTADERRSFELLDEFVAQGYNLIDTADVYSRWVPGHRGGESETILGHWLKERGRRRDVLIATKVGMEAESGQGLSRAHIERSVEGSLARLGVDAIDLYFSHTDDPDTPVAETLETYRDLRDAGKVRAIGASNFSAARLAESLQVSRRDGLPAYSCLQPRYNLMDRADYEGALEEVCRTHALGVVTYSSLASGFLTGKYRTPEDLGKSPRGARAGPRLDDRGRRILAALDAAAAENNAKPATVALAWLMARPGITAPIASATSIPQLEELTAAGRLRLSPAAVDALDRASA